MGVRTWTDPPPVVAAPVGQVVPALVGRGAGPVADLVPGQPGSAHHFIGQDILVRVVVVVDGRDLPAPHPGGELGAFLDDQGIGRDVVRLVAERFLQGDFPVRHGLPGRAVDQVHADVQAGVACPLHCLRNPGRGVRAVQHGQHVGHGRLHAEGDPREAGVGEQLQGLRRHRVGIGLGGDFGTGLQSPLVDGGPQDHGQILGREQRGSAAAEEDGAHRPLRHPGAAQRVGSEHHFLRGRGAVGRLGRTAAEFGGGVGVEVAVAAADGAERNVDVESEVPVRCSVRGLCGEEAVRRCGVSEGQCAGCHFLDLSLDSSEESAATKASCGTSTRPTIFMRFLPSFCFSSSLRLRLMSPP